MNLNMDHILGDHFSDEDRPGYRLTGTDRITVSRWVRLKCTFGCDSYGKLATCPPNLPAVSECEKLFGEYEHAVIFHFQKELERPEERHEWTRVVNKKLLGVERDVFLAGHHKAFMMFIDPCNLCKACVEDKIRCLNPRQARPSPEGMAVDVFATARSVGFPIEVLTDYAQTMNRIGILLIE